MDNEVCLANLQRQSTAVVRGHVTQDDIATFLGEAFGEVMTALSQQGLTPAGPPFGRYVQSDDGFDVEAGFPVDRPVTSTERVTAGELPGGSVAYTVHVGAYDTVAAAYAATLEWLSDNGFVVSGDAWESYLDGPDVPRPRTEVFVPCKPVVPITAPITAPITQ
jgi:effector-binding domain-containing protein